MTNLNISYQGSFTTEEKDIVLETIVPNCLDSMLSNQFDENVTEDQGSIEPQDMFGWVVEGPLIFIAFLVGVVGNGFSVMVFSRQKVHRIFHHLLLLLSIFDMVSNNMIIIYVKSIRKVDRFFILTKKHGIKPHIPNVL